MYFREMGVSGQYDACYSFYADEDTPELVEDLYKRSNAWLQRHGIVLGEGETTVHEVPKHLQNNGYHLRFAYMINGPRLAGPFTLVEQIKD